MLSGQLLSTITCKADHNRRSEKEREERMGRTKVALLEYPDDGGAPSITHFSDSADLDKHISEIDEKDSSSIRFRLFVAEDLSRQVIETLGSRYDVDPSFFREHIADYVWYNISGFNPSCV